MDEVSPLRLWYRSHRRDQNASQIGLPHSTDPMLGGPSSRSRREARTRERHQSPAEQKTRTRLTSTRRIEKSHGWKPNGVKRRCLFTSRLAVILASLSPAPAGGLLLCGHRHSPDHPPGKSTARCLKELTNEPHSSALQTSGIHCRPCRRSGTDLSAPR